MGQDTANSRKGSGLLIFLGFACVVISFPPPSFGAGLGMTGLSVSLVGLVLAITGTIRYLREIKKAVKDDSQRLYLSILVPAVPSTIIIGYVTILAGFHLDAVYIVGLILYPSVLGALSETVG